VVAGLQEQTHPPAYKTRNWPACNEALKRRGSLAIWFDPEMSWEAAPTGKRGRQQTYSNTAIRPAWYDEGAVRHGLAAERTGFVESLLRLIGLDRAVPDFSTLSRRQKTLTVNIPYRGSKGPQHLLIDSTGIKVEGEGEWSARKHGGPKRPSPRLLEPVAKPRLDWRKLHIGVDESEEEQETVRWTVSPTNTGDPGCGVHHQRRG